MGKHSASRNNPPTMQRGTVHTTGEKFKGLEEDEQPPAKESVQIDYEKPKNFLIAIWAVLAGLATAGATSSLASFLL